MTLDEYKEKIKVHVSQHNDFKVNVDDLFNYTDDAKLKECLEKNVPIEEVALYCILAGMSIK